MNGRQEMAQRPSAQSPIMQALGKSDSIRHMAEECAKALSLVNKILKDAMTEHGPLPSVTRALVQSEQAESKAGECVEVLGQLNQVLQEELKERLELEDAALHDWLTSLPNRFAFNELLSHDLAQSKRHGWNLALLFIDLDDFKRVNDTWGHEVGDQVLRIVAQRLWQMMREQDVLCRLGGDEFLCLLLDVDEDEAARVARKIIDKLAEPCPAGAPRPVCIRPSIGIACYPRNAASGEQLIAHADKAMFQAKREGTGYGFFHESSEMPQDISS